MVSPLSINSGYVIMFPWIITTFFLPKYVNLLLP